MDGTQQALTPRDPVAPTPVTPERFAHFVLRTAQLPAMRDWYRTVLNARIVQENDFICFLTYDDEHHRLALINVPGLVSPTPQTLGLNHVAYSYRTLGELLATYVRLRDNGIKPFRPINHGPTVSMYYHDPDGNGVELQVDAYPTKAEAMAFFTTDAFRENPIGVRFEPEELLTAYEAGVPEAELLRRPAGPAEPSMARRS
jgi:catechol 2,3-dioxygenase-like lactoylglutathione lyase family enzyme